MSAKIIPITAASLLRTPGAPRGPSAPEDGIEMAAPLSDEALLAACATGDPAALSALYRRHVGSIHRFLSRLVGPRSSALDDLVQQVFMDAWRGARGYRGQSAVRAWLFGIAANLARKHHRSEKRRSLAMSLLALRPERTVRTPHDQVAEQQLVDQLARGLAALPEDLRVAYLMCEVEDVPGVEAARVLGVRPGTLWRRLHEARKRLRAMIHGGVS